MFAIEGANIPEHQLLPWGCNIVHITARTTSTLLT